MKARVFTVALAVLGVAVLHGACHPGASISRTIDAEPVLAELVAASETSDSPGGDATEGIRQEQLEQADAVRMRLAAIDDAAPTDPERRAALAIERTELAVLLGEIEESALDSSTAGWLELRQYAARAIDGERSVASASRTAVHRAATRRAK